jgi:hypothetical protein
MSHSARHQEKRRQRSRLSKAQKQQREKSSLGQVNSARHKALEAQRGTSLEKLAKDIALAKELGL